MDHRPTVCLVYLCCFCNRYDQLLNINHLRQHMERHHHHPYPHSGRGNCDRIRDAQYRYIQNQHDADFLHVPCTYCGFGVEEDNLGELSQHYLDNHQKQQQSQQRQSPRNVNAENVHRHPLVDALLGEIDNLFRCFENILHLRGINDEEEEE